MTGIIIPGNPLYGSEVKGGKPFADLLDDPFKDTYHDVEQRFVQLLRKSFQEDGEKYGKDFASRMQTEAEMKRRADILGKWFRILRGDKGFSLRRALDHCGKALRAELDGQTYDPPQRSRLWAPE